MSTEAIDLSNYTTSIATWHAGLSHALVQAIDPPPGYPAGQTRAQIQACVDAGLTVDAYIWLWFELGVDDIQHKLSLLDGLAIRTIWLDVEDRAAQRFNQADTEAIIQRALDACDAYGTWLVRPKGIYTGRWFWADPRFLANSVTFADRPLWDANYDGMADASVGFVPYGGWTGCAIKQYAGTSTVNGIGNVDRDVLSDAETLLLVKPA